MGIFLYRVSASLSLVAASLAVAVFDPLWAAFVLMVGSALLLAAEGVIWCLTQRFQE